MSTDKEEQIRRWMEDIAQKRTPKKKLIFDPITKRLIPVNPEDPRADDCLSFDQEEATRFRIYS